MSASPQIEADHRRLHQPATGVGDAGGNRTEPRAASDQLCSLVYGWLLLGDPSFLSEYMCMHVDLYLLSDVQSDDDSCSIPKLLRVSVC